LSLVELARFFSPIEAEVRRLALESHGIHAVVFDSGLNYSEGGGLATAARLMVLEVELEEAASILRDDQT
jgi:hypothetical protein